MWFIERGDKPVVIEYTSRGQRVRKELPNAFKARTFYCQKFKDGKRPQIIRSDVAKKGASSGD